MGIFIPINKEQMKELTNETKETPAVHAIHTGENNCSFGSVDLWTATKQQPTKTDRRRWLNE